MGDTILPALRTFQSQGEKFEITVPDYWVVLDLDPEKRDAFINWFVEEQSQHNPFVSRFKADAKNNLRAILNGYSEVGVSFAAILGDWDGEKTEVITFEIKNYHLGEDVQGELTLENVLKEFAENDSEYSEQQIILDSVELPIGPVAEVRRLNEINFLGHVYLCLSSQFIILNQETKKFYILNFTTPNIGNFRKYYPEFVQILLSFKFL